MILCGIDASTTKTSISLFKDGKYVEYKLIDLHIIKDKDQRVNQMMLEMDNILNEYSPDVIYYEDTWSSLNQEVNHILSVLQGSVRFWALLHLCRFKSIKPSSWRAVLGLSNGRGIKREELKQQSINTIKELLNIDVPTDDVSDSILIGMAGCKIEKSE